MGHSSSNIQKDHPIGEVVGNEDNLKEVEAMMKRCTIEQAHQEIEEKMEGWQNIAINVCLLGESGVGKSSFINNIIGKPVAKVGIIETTRVAQSYIPQDDKRLVIWDMPGYGCDLYPTINSYIKSMAIQRFDISILMHKERFKDNDQKVMDEIKKVGKPFFIVRSNVDEDTRDKTIQQVKLAVQKTLISYQSPCYFICNRSHDFDYEDLVNDLFVVYKELFEGFHERLEKLLPGDILIGEDDLKKEMDDIIKKYDLEEAKLKIQEKLDAWKKVPVNFCLLGESGVGKSTFINNIIGKEVAQVGIVECTFKQKSYPHPDNEKLLFWDFPGFGCKIYPTVKSYIDRLDIKRFDVIIFLYKSRFKSSEAELAKEIKALGKPFFILRSKFDIDIQDGNVEETKRIILKDLRKHLPKEKCYFISNITRRFDYEILLEDIFTSLKDSTKAQVLAFSLPNTNKAIINVKKQQLYQRIWVASTVAAGLGAIPVPGVDVVLNAALVVEEIHFMMKVLGVLEVLRGNKIKFYTNCAGYLTVSGVASLIAKISIPIAGDEVFKLLIPGIGSIISSAVAFVVTKLTLQKVLADLVEVAELEMESQRKENEIEMENLEKRNKSENPIHFKKENF